MAILHRGTLGNILLWEVDADPNGVESAPRGSFALDSAIGALYVNTDGANTWVKAVQNEADLRAVAAALTASIDLNAQDVTNAGSYNGVAVEGHAARHTDGSDDIQDATAGQKGLATAAQITKLDGIEALADITDKDNVRTALADADDDKGLSAVRVNRALYDFAVDGGAQGAIAISGAVLPVGAVPIRSGYDVVDAMTSGGAATVELRYQHAAGPTFTTIQADAAFNDASYALGVHAAAQTGYGAAGATVEAGGQIEIVISAADLTAGKIVVWVEYLMTEG